jgi:hypothetical protein
VTVTHEGTELIECGIRKIHPNQGGGGLGGNDAFEATGERAARRQRITTCAWITHYKLTEWGLNAAIYQDFAFGYITIRPWVWKG